jgi:tetratricopeptide (TPR) repeat protein
MSIRFGLLFTLAISTFSAAALAQEPAASGNANATAEARERFQRGVALYREGSFDAALAEFQRAYDIEPNYRVLFNLAQVQVERHDAVAALALFDRYLRQGGNEIEPDRRAQVEKDEQALRARVAELTVESNPAGAQLSIDNVEAGTLPLAAPVLVNSGVHQITLTKAGYRSASRNLTIAGAQPLRVQLTLQPLDGRLDDSRSGTPPLGEAHGDAQGASGSHGLSTGFWVSAVVTGALAAGAVTFAVVTEKSNRDLDTELNRFPESPSAVSNARTRLKTDAALTDALSGAAVVGLATTLYFAFTSGRPSERPAKSSLPERVQLGTRGSSLVLSGNF